MSITRILTTLFCSSLLLFPFVVQGADRGSPSVTAGNELDLRLGFIEERLDAGKRHAQYWQNGWTGFYAVSGLAQTVSWLDADNNDDRINYVVGAIKSTGGLIDILLRPMPGRYGADEIRGMKAPSFDKLGQAEDLLQATARRALEKSTWKPHLKVMGVNLLGGAVILAFGDGGDALLSTAMGIAVGEANIWTQPTRPIVNLQDYQSNYSALEAQAPYSWQLLPFPGGIMVRGSF
jgi:hypothetical protein